MQEVGKSCLPFTDYCWEDEQSPKEDAIEQHEEEGEYKNIAAYFKTTRQMMAASAAEERREGSTTRS